MEIDERRLGGRVGVDTSVLISVANENDAHHRASVALVVATLGSTRTLVIPAIAYGEFVGGGAEDLGRESGTEVVAFDDVCARMLKDVPPSVWKGLPSGRHVAKVDALIAITAKRHNVSIFVTNDEGQLAICERIGLHAARTSDLRAAQGTLVLEPPASSRFPDE